LIPTTKKKGIMATTAAPIEIWTSSASHPGPLALADVAQLLGQQALPDDTQLWVGEDGPKKALGDIVDVGDAGEVGDDEDGLEELSELLEATLLAEPEPEPELYTAEELTAIEAVRVALRAEGIADEMIGEAMLVSRIAPPATAAAATIRNRAVASKTTVA
jgi:hypothetical protein